jgi:CobQ-like glutamine amidotransferase family enzyme
MEGIALLDVDTVAGPTRLIGDLVIAVDFDGELGTVVGFENHAGRTRLGANAERLGTVVSGNGNNGEDGVEGARQGRIVGTYLHGPLLPKNPWFADRLLTWALDHSPGGVVSLEPLDDSLEALAHATAIRRARKPRR